MGRDTYVVHNAYFDSGGALGIFSTLPAAYLEAVTGRPFASFFNCLSGASIGGVNATSLAIGVPAAQLAHSIYACSIDLLKPSSHALVVGQIINQKVFRGHHVLRDHYDHSVLYRMLKPHYGDMTMSDAPVSLLVTAHNMNAKRDVLLGCVDPDIFDASAFQVPLVNGSTPLIDGAMATTSIPSIFPPYDIRGEHYHDNGMMVSAGMVHKEIDAALKARQKVLHDTPMGRFRLMRAFQRLRPGALTLANADHALVRTLFLGTGDMSEIPYTPETQLRAGFLGAIDDTQYSTLHAAKGGTQAQNARDMARMYDPASIRATGMPAMTTINRSIIPRPGTAEMGRFPNPSPLDASPANLHRVFEVAALNVADNRDKLAGTLQEIADTQLAQGVIGAETHRKLRRDAETISVQDPWKVLEGIIVTDKTGPAIYRQYSPVVHRVKRPEARVA